MLIQLKEVGKTHRLGEVAIPVLEGVNLTIAAGESVGIVGASGSGKTTLLDIIGCLSRPTSGAYFLKGTPTADLSDLQHARLRNQTFGFVFQTFHLMGRHTALANVALPLFYAGVPQKARVTRAEAALARVGLADRMRHRPSQLSGGQQQRVAIARALINQPDIILADEPTGNLDSKSGGEIMDLLLDLHRAGRTLILVTHDPQMAARVHRRVTIKDGRILSDVSD